jgi:CheY-like chemotaxis protein
MEDQAAILSAKDAFRHAKVEHYLRRAEECVQMRRYGPALKTLDIVLELDPRNEQGIALKQSVEERVDFLHHRSNGGSARREPAAEHVRKRNELVLVVDQEERVLCHLSETLAKYGYEVVCAGGYDEAMETLAALKPDVIVSEVNFESGPQGFDLFFWVKTQSSFAAVPFIFFAARIDREMLVAGKRFGVDDFIQKPADAEIVTASIANSLNHRRKTAN